MKLGYAVNYTNIINKDMRLKKGDFKSVMEDIKTWRTTMFR